jgi:hypothetical protein
MKFYITFKTPDVVSEALEDKIRNIIPSQEFTQQELASYDSIEDEDEKAEYVRFVVVGHAEFIDDLVRYGELVTVEFDSVTKTATVVK